MMNMGTQELSPYVVQTHNNHGHATSQYVYNHSGGVGGGQSAQDHNHLHHVLTSDYTSVQAAAPSDDMSFYSESANHAHGLSSVPQLVRYE